MRDYLILALVMLAAVTLLAATLTGCASVPSLRPVFTVQTAAQVYAQYNAAHVSSNVAEINRLWLNHPVVITREKARLTGE